MRRKDRPQFPIAPILEYFGAEMVPRVRGAGHRKILCPFHVDSQPSASVSEYGFKCFSCPAQGDAIKLLRDEEGLSYADSVKRCETIVGGEGVSVSRERGGWGDLLSE